MQAQRDVAATTAEKSRVGVPAVPGPSNIETTQRRNRDACRTQSPVTLTHNGALEIIESWTGYNSGTGTLIQSPMSYGCRTSPVGPAGQARVERVAGRLLSEGHSLVCEHEHDHVVEQFPTHIGLACYSTSAKAIVTFECFRRMSGAS
jgi:hypothetical protein